MDSLDDLEEQEFTFIEKVGTQYGIAIIDWELPHGFSMSIFEVKFSKFGKLGMRKEEFDGHLAFAVDSEGVVSIIGGDPELLKKIVEVEGYTFPFQSILKESGLTPVKKFQKWIWRRT